jgi:hypothetical protein
MQWLASSGSSLPPETSRDASELARLFDIAFPIITTSTVGLETCRPTRMSLGIDRRGSI